MFGIKIATRPPAKAPYNPNAPLFACQFVSSTPFNALLIESLITITHNVVDTALSTENPRNLIVGHSIPKKETIQKHITSATTINKNHL